MKLNKKHIGKLFNLGSDGSWVYQLVAVNKTHLLFYEFDGHYYKEEKGKHTDWVYFKPRKTWPKHLLKFGWMTAKGETN